MGRRSAHSLHGGAGGSSRVPDAAIQAGPAYDIDGILVLRGSFLAKCPRALDGVQGQYLADALAVWDCLADRWMKGVLLLRFEDFDAVFSVAADGGLASWQGSVDTSGGMTIVARSLGEEPDEDACPVWMPVPALSRIVGSQATGVAEAGDTGASIFFVEGDLHLEIRHGEMRHRLVPSASVL